MTARSEIAQSPCETGTWSLGTDTLPRVCAWCLSPSEPGQAPARTTESVPKQDVDRPSGEPARHTKLRLSRSLQSNASGEVFCLQRLRFTARLVAAADRQLQ